MHEYLLPFDAEIRPPPAADFGYRRLDPAIFHGDPPGARPDPHPRGREMAGGDIPHPRIFRAIKGQGDPGMIFILQLS